MSLGSILRAVAPVLADLLPGPLGGAVGKVIAEAIGKPGATEAEIEKTLVDADPELLLKLKAAENDFILRMKEKGVDLEKIAADDRANARAMQVQTRAKSPAVLATVLMGGFFITFGLLFCVEPPTGSKEAIMLMVGALIARSGTVVDFFFGSSTSSHTKDETISKLSG